MTRILLAAAVYNICWGLVVVCWPGRISQLLGVGPMGHLEVWQYVGVLVGLYGVAYFVAAGNPIRHWPIVFVGLLLKCFGPVGFVHAVMNGQMHWRFGWTVLANDVVWWAPFAWILMRAYAAELASRRTVSSEVQEFALRVRTNTGIALSEMSRQQPVMLVFLRHIGCPFCRETLAVLARERGRLELCGTALVLVHMATEEHADRLLARYGLAGTPRISDRERTLYRAFGLVRGSLMQNIGPHLWFRGIKAMLRHGNSLASTGGDLFQLSGVFLVYHGHVVRSFLHQTAADRPDFVQFAQTNGIPGTEALP